MGLVDKTEALYIEVAHQIALTDDWITPHWNGKYFFDYPIGGYWFIALSFKLFGVSEWAARFPVALFAIALVVLGFYTLRYFGMTAREAKPDERQLWLTAWIGAGILAMNPGWVGWGRAAVSDLFLSSAIGMAMLAFFLGYAQPENPKVQQRWYMVSPVFAAIAVLAKGPVGVLLPVLSISVFLLYVGKFWEVLREFPLLKSILIFLAVTVPWYGAAIWVNGQIFIDTFFGMSNFKRFTHVLYNHEGPWYYYFLWVIVLLLPWSIFLPLAIARLRFWERAGWMSAPRSTQLGLFALSWFVVIFLFFSVAVTKLPGYILPLIPAGAIIVTLYWSEELKNVNLEEKKALPFLISAGFNLLILLALAVASFLSPQLAGNDPTMPTLRPALEASGLPLKSAIIWGIAALVGIVFLWRRRYWRWFWGANMIGFLAFLTFVVPPVIPFLDFHRQLPFRELSIQVGKVAQPDEEVFLMGFRRYSVVYYSQHRVEFFDGVESARDYLKDPKLSKSNLATVLILTEPKFIENFGLKPQDYQVIDSKGAYQIIRVKKERLWP
jgi:4-amino-4-deoxy-L-arabinose transferase-like glycosyltransferase